MEYIRVYPEFPTLIMLFNLEDEVVFSTKLMSDYDFK